MTQRFNTLDDAIALAEFAHRKQVDKSGQPYIAHPLRVMLKVAYQNAPNHVKIAAVLHDVTEDTKFSPVILLHLGVPEAAVSIIKLLDRNISKEVYDNCGDRKGYEIRGEKKWIDGYYEDHSQITKDEYYYAKIGESPDARMVKLADIEDNLSPWRLASLEEATQDRLKKKYADAQEILGGFSSFRRLT